MLTKLLLFPYGGNGREALNAILALNRVKPTFEVLGFVDDDCALLGREMAETRVLGGREIFTQYPEAKVLAVVGNPENFSKRKKIIEGLGIEEARFVSVVHPAATVAADVQIGCNTLLLANVVVSPGARIGNHCLVLANTSVGHDSSIGNYASVASNVAICGNVTIEDGCYVGAGSVIKNNLCVGENSLIGCGSNVVSDVTSSSVVAGNPAKQLKEKAS